MSVVGDVSLFWKAVVWWPHTLRQLSHFQAKKATSSAHQICEILAPVHVFPGLDIAAIKVTPITTSRPSFPFAPLALLASGRQGSHVVGFCCFVTHLGGLSFGGLSLGRCRLVRRLVPWLVR